MATETQQITSLLSSKICHDLASPISAIQNALELLELGGLDEGPEVSLLRDSVRSATARVEFFRIAFGKASADMHVSASELQRLSDTGFGTGRTKVEWVNDQDIPRHNAKTVCLLLLCLDSLLTIGGKITVSANGDAWQINSSAKRIADDVSPLDYLTGDREPDGLDPSMIHFALASNDLSRLPARPHIRVDADSIALSLALSA